MKVENETRDFLDRHQAELAPVMRRAYTSYWRAATTGSRTASDEYASAEAEIKRLHSDAGKAKRIRGWLSNGTGHDPVLRRQLTLLDLSFRGNLLSPEVIYELTGREAALERLFTTFRSTLEGENRSNNELRELLVAERSSHRRRSIWEASKQIGREAAGPLLELVRRRNQAARSLGFTDYYQMSLTLQEQDEDELFSLLEEFRVRSDEPFRQLRSGMDGELARRFGVTTGELRPWHWDDFFSQEAPAADDLDLDAFFAGVDQEQLAREFFAGVGLPVDEVLRQSDLYEREGKSQHAFCINIDREGDVRVLCNLRPTEHWTMVLLHELGHAVHDRYLDPSLPFLLRAPAHTFTTEAVAMYMGRLTRDPRWLREAAGKEIDDETARRVSRQLRTQMLVSARWMLVMAHFERALYRDPDRADLNRLWWDTVERFQLVRRPDGRQEPDWAAKIHLSNAPVYYHNYLLGEWMASQLSAHIDREVRAENGNSVAQDPAVGNFFRSELFARGASLPWNQLLQAATGEGLTPIHFVEEFVTLPISSPTSNRNPGRSSLLSSTPGSNSATTVEPR